MSRNPGWVGNQLKWKSLNTVFPLSFKVFRETSNWGARVWPMTLTISIPPYYNNYSIRYAIEGHLVPQAGYFSLSSIGLWKRFQRLNYESAFRVNPNTSKLCENIQDFNTWNPGRLFCKTRVDKMFLPLFEQIVHHWLSYSSYNFASPRYLECIQIPWIGCCRRIWNSWLFVKKVFSYRIFQHN